MTSKAANTEHPPSPPVDPQALRIVLFGMPDAGKSSLLGALAQSAQTQERQLQGRLFDTSSGLAELQHRVYDEKPRETLQEIIPYPVRYEPLKGNKPDPSERVEAVLIDCDGRAANQILTQQKSLDDPRAGQLVDAIRRADALVLVIDASATDEQIDADFAEFTRFLHLLEENRAGRSEVGGLPVFLALSKCDLLAKPNEPATSWAKHIDERRREVEQRFKDYMQEDDAGFGSVDLELVTTAVRRPAFIGPSGSREPYGVADMFRKVIFAAREYRQRTQGSQRRLLTIAAGAIVFVTLLIGGAAALLLTRENIQPVALSSTVESYRSRENPTPSTRLTEPLQRKISELIDIQKHPDFSKLSEEQRTFVEQRSKELVAYQEFKSRLERERAPAELRTPEELTRLETRLGEALHAPTEFQNEWAQTEAELLRQKWLEDIQLIRRAATEMVERYNGFITSGTELLQFKNRTGGALPWSEWHDRLRDLFARAARQPYPEAEPLRESRSLPALRAPTVTYASVYNYRPVDDARREWELIRGRLEHVRDLSLALGLVGDGSADASPLRIPEGFSAEQARIRLELLKKNYPKYADWAFAELSTMAAPEVRATAEKSYQRMIEAGRTVVLAELGRLTPDGRETRDRWLAVSRWLPEAAELRDWGQLIKVVQRLSGEPAEDPAGMLAAFLQKSSFPINLSTVRVTIPDEIHESRLRPTGNFTITHKSGAASQVQLRRLDESSRDNRNRVTTFSFVAEGTSGVVYTPGDTLVAELALRDESNKDWKLTWQQSKSELYTFECLRRPPRFNPPNVENPTSGRLVDVQLSFTPDAGVPRVPDLMPIVILKR